MKVEIDMSILLDAVMEYFDCETDYTWSSKKYYKKHGHGVYFADGKKLTPEEKHIEYAYHEQNRTWSQIRSLEEIFKLDPEGRNRLISAGRAARKWYIKTNWERCIPEETCDKLQEYVFGEQCEKRDRWNAWWDR